VALRRQRACDVAAGCPVLPLPAATDGRNHVRGAQGVISSMRTLAISNHKGGSGKTTTAVNLAACLAERGRRVLLVDLDPQASASAWCGIHAPQHDVSEAFLHGTSLAGLLAKSSWLDVDVLPASTALSGLEKALASEVGSETLMR